jgi:hypothetical protein
MSISIEQANRESGKWVKGNCQKRCIPCGNPLCVDEAMRASEIKKSSPLGAKQAEKHAYQTVKGCFSDGSASFHFPLGNSREKVNEVIETLVSRKS